MDKEQITFDGIPIPLTMETLLDAYNHSWIDYDWWEEPRRHRQMTAFRARILRTFAVCKSINADLLTEIEMQNARIAELEAELEETAGELINTDAKLRDEKYPRS